MKKQFLLISILLIGITIFITGCDKKVAITADEFRSKMTEKQFDVVDANGQFKGEETLKQVYLAMNSDYQIEFYELVNSEAGKIFYNINQQKFEKSKGSSSFYSTINLNNYNKYTLETDGKYKVISRIDNTAIYINVSVKYKDDINEIIKELGY